MERGVRLISSGTFGKYMHLMWGSQSEYKIAFICRRREEPLKILASGEVNGYIFIFTVFRARELLHSSLENLDIILSGVTSERQDN